VVRAVTALAFALALASQQPLGPFAPSPSSGWAPTWWGGRILTTDTIHLGVRPAAFVDNGSQDGRLEVGVGVTVQVTGNVF
jgi:hypothetical protein